MIWIQCRSCSSKSHFTHTVRILIPASVIPRLKHVSFSLLCQPLASGAMPFYWWLVYVTDSPHHTDMSTHDVVIDQSNDNWFVTDVVTSRHEVIDQCHAAWRRHMLPSSLKRWESAKETRQSETLACYYALFSSWHTSMSYLVPSRNGEESFNTFVSLDPYPDSDHLRGGRSHGYTPSCKKIRQSE